MTSGVCPSLPPRLPHASGHRHDDGRSQLMNQAGVVLSLCRYHCPGSHHAFLEPAQPNSGLRAWV